MRDNRSAAPSTPTWAQRLPVQRIRRLADLSPLRQRMCTHATELMLVCQRSGTAGAVPLGPHGIRYMVQMHALAARALRVMGICTGHGVSGFAQTSGHTHSRTPPPTPEPVVEARVVASAVPALVRAMAPAAPRSVTELSDCSSDSAADEAGSDAEGALSVGVCRPAETSSDCETTGGYSADDRVIVQWSGRPIVRVTPDAARGVRMAFVNLEKGNALASLRQFVRAGEPHSHTSTVWYTIYMRTQTGVHARNPVLVPLTDMTFSSLLNRLGCPMDTIAYSTIEDCLYGVYGPGYTLGSQLRRLCEYFDSRMGWTVAVTPDVPALYTVRSILAAYSIYMRACPDAHMQL